LALLSKALNLKHNVRINITPQLYRFFHDYMYSGRRKGDISPDMLQVHEHSISTHRHPLRRIQQK